MAVNQDFPGTLVKPKGRNVWVYQIYMPGRTIFKRSTGKTNYQAAVAEARKLYRQALLLSASPDASLEDLQLKLGKAVVQEVKRIEDLGNPDRAQRVSYCLENFYNWAGNIPLDKITTDMLARYQVFRSTCKKKINVGKDRKTRQEAQGGRPISTSTIVMEVQYVIRMLKNNGFTVAKPKPPKKREAHAGRPFTPEELKKFFEACNAYPNEDPGRYTPLFMLILSAGARPAELVP